MIDTARATALAAAMCRHFEGWSSTPYLCNGRVPTIGYGATFYEDGIRVTLLDKPISRLHGERLLAYQLRRVFLAPVMRECPTLETDEELAALMSWTFNLGLGNLRSSTLRRVIRARQWDQVAPQMRRWRYAGGVELRGLIRRREAEIALGGFPGARVGVLPAEVVRALYLPPQ